MSFDRAFEFVIGVEGGLSNDAQDPGGLTRYGISQRAYPDEDIRGMTLERAKLIYRRDYWDPMRCDEMPYPVALCLFDFGVNSGASQAVRALQRALRITPDGFIGTQTLLAIQRFEPVEMALDLQAERILYMSSLPTWSRFGRGWTRRVIKGAVNASQLKTSE